MSFIEFIFFCLIVYVITRLEVKYEIKSNIDLFYDLHREEVIRLLNKYEKK